MFLMNGKFKLFQFRGIQVYLHSSWILAAFFLIQWESHRYSSPAWNVIEYLGLFLIVLLHEFGHALACRSVGGKADTIVLWPLGGVAFVSPPPRPGATLWSIAAGPLVNVILAPVLFAVARSFHHPGANPDLYALFNQLYLINIMLLIFNILPVYPLDGGQILRSLLWFVVGPRKSLYAATVIGLLGAVAVGALGVSMSLDGKGGIYVIALAVFMGTRAFRGFQFARTMTLPTDFPTRAGYACPGCGKAPPIAPVWKCACGEQFDTFENNGQCPNCGKTFATTACASCHKSFPFNQWSAQHGRAMPPPMPAGPVSVIPDKPNPYRHG